MTAAPSAARSVTSIRDDVAEGRLKVSELIEATLARIERLDSQVGAFLWTDRERALLRARDLDRRVKNGETSGRLLGVPVAVKDNICVSGSPCTCGSRILKEYSPPYDAHVVERLEAEGAVIVGKTNCDEFAMGSSTENSAYQVTRNPHDLGRVPGGSSGGSTAAVAAGMVPVSLGSDTGGSIRQPAALCGVVGFKPTYGTVSRYGLIAFASSLDQIGPIGASVHDVAVVASAISGPDPRDSTSLPLEARDYASALTADLEGVRIGVHRDYYEEVADKQIRLRIKGAIQELREAGARIIRIDDLDLLSRFAIPTYYLVANSEASSNLARFDGLRYGPRVEGGDLLETYTATRGRFFGEEVTRRILLGTFALSSGYYDAYYKKALQVRRLFREAYSAAFEKVDLIVGATTPEPAFPLGQRTDDPLTMYQCDLLTVPASLVGLPAVSVPCGFTESKLPTGLQIIGPPLSDAAVLSCAFAYERRSGFKGLLPDLETPT